MRIRHLLIALGFIIAITVSACSSSSTPDSDSNIQNTPVATKDLQDEVSPKPTASPEPMAAPTETPTETSTLTETSTPTVTSTNTPEPTPETPQPINTQDAEPLEAAILFNTDFEDTYPRGLYDWSGRWYIRNQSDGNAVFCNEISGDWSGFVFGRDEWDDYAVSLRMKFLSDNEEQSAETYIRINESVEGYRASISDNQRASIGFCPPCSGLGESSISIDREQWVQVELRFVEDRLEYFINNEMVLEVIDESRMSGRAGFGASPNTQVCVDDIMVWELDEKGNPVKSTDGMAIEPFDTTVYTISQKLANRPTVPVFYPWSGSGQGINCDQPLWFDCDINHTPYSLTWTSSGIATDIESTQPKVSWEQTSHMRADNNTIYIISEEWHYWNLTWRNLSSDSKFYLDEVYEFHVDSEYGDTKVINFEHPDWPDLLAEKALNFKNAGFDGMILDWWHNGAGNGRSEEDVEVARIAISKAIREKVGDDFILMGNVNWSVDDPTAQYLSGVFLELWKSHPGNGYALTYSDEDGPEWNPSIERMEDLLKYWDTNLKWPKVINFEPWKITTSDYVADRNTPENYRYAKLFAAMAMVIPEHGYILYADNNDDWDGGDHQHAYYDFYLTDLGKPTSSMIEAAEGVAYKQYEKGIIAYNRTTSEVDVTLPSGEHFTIGPLEGLLLED